MAAVPVLTGLAVLSTTWAWADLQSSLASREQARQQEQYAETGRLPAYADWLSVRQILQTALVADGGNPDFIEQAGYLSYMQSKDGETYRDFSAAARDFYLRAAVLRPDSAYTWARLAEVKYRLGEIDAQLYQSITNAVLLGPWEPEVQMTVLDIGFALWDEMPAMLRERVMVMSHNAERRNADQLLNIAQRRRRLDLVCGSVKLGNMMMCRESRDK